MSRRYVLVVVAIPVSDDYPDALREVRAKLKGPRLDFSMRAPGWFGLQLIESGQGPKAWGRVVLKLAGDLWDRLAQDGLLDARDAPALPPVEAGS